MGVVDHLTERDAHHWLATLRDRWASEGLAAAAALPGLGAAVDQHAAAVRDILRHGLIELDGAPAASGRVLLAGYGRGLLAGAGVTLDELAARAGRTAGWWARADGVAVRLLAVCALSRSLGVDRRPAG